MCNKIPPVAYGVCCALVRPEVLTAPRGDGLSLGLAAGEQPRRRGLAMLQLALASASLVANLAGDQASSMGSRARFGARANPAR